MLQIFSNSKESDLNKIEESIDGLLIKLQEQNSKEKPKKKKDKTEIKLYEKINVTHRDIVTT